MTQKYADEPKNPNTDECGNYLKPAVAWVGERGGPAACARDVLKMTAGSDDSERVRAALKKAGAPETVYGLLGRYLYEAARMSRRQTDERLAKLRGQT